MQTQVCWTPNPVTFPQPREEESGGLHLPSHAPAFISLWLFVLHIQLEGQLVSLGPSLGLHSPSCSHSPLPFPQPVHQGPAAFSPCAPAPGAGPQTAAQQAGGL